MSATGASEATPIPTGNLEFVLHQLERVLSTQLTSVDGLWTKSSITLGFAVTLFGGLFGLARETIAAHPAAAFGSAAVFSASILLMAYPLLVREYEDAPHPFGLLRNIRMSNDELMRQIVANLADACMRNKATIARAFSTLNAGLILFVLGTFVFAFGVVLT